MNKKILIFAGTTEGRKLAEYLRNTEIEVTVSVATEYGEKLIKKGKNIKISAQRLDEEKMIKFMLSEKFEMVIDATHPYAIEVTRNIFKACETANIQYIRLLRNIENDVNGEKIIRVSTVKEAVDFLNTTQGNILVTTGSKELEEFTKIKNYKQRVYARVLSVEKSMISSVGLGFEGKNLICMQGPFSQEFNYALIKQIDAKYLVTKESGQVGGFEEKINAAQKAGIITVIIGHIQEEKGCSLQEVEEFLNKKFLLKSTREISLVGIGSKGRGDN